MGRVLWEMIEDASFIAVMLLVIVASPFLLIYGLGYACAAGLEAWCARRR